MRPGGPTPEPLRCPSNTPEPGGEAFDRMLAERRERVETNRAESGAPQDEDGRAAESDPPDERTVRAASDRPRNGEADAGAGKAGRNGITLLGARFGTGAATPSLTFVLPSGAGPADMAEAVRTQVLRLAAARQIEPGAVDNLRLAVTSRELGRVDVDIAARGDRLEVSIRAAGDAAEAALRRTSGELRDGILARTGQYRHVDIKIEGRNTAEQEQDAREGSDRRESGGRSDADRRERDRERGNGG
jgi:hypothetical protein